MLVHRKEARVVTRQSKLLPISLIAISLMLASGVAAISILLSTTDNLWKSPRQVFNAKIMRLGWSVYEEKDLLSSLLSIPGRYIKAAGTNPDIPELVLDIKFKHIQKLRAKRETALKKGVLIQERGDFVPAQLRLGDREVDVRVRLKGDRLDHIQDKKWSMRVEVKGDDHIFGMRRFSLQHPVTRGFHAEPLFLESLRHMGVLAGRYQFVTVVINGDSIGIMALEEHFSKELLEHQARREGVILRFNEQPFWDHVSLGSDLRSSAFNNFRNARVDAFRTKRIRKSPQMLAQYQTAVGLMRRFVAGHVPASEVFDIETSARYLALLELWGSWHGIQWNDMRFYLDPLTLKLEPIGYDANLTLHSKLNELTVRREPILAAMLEDDLIRERYIQQLRQLCQAMIEGELGQKLEMMQDRQLSLLRDEFYFLEKLDLEKLKERARFLLQLDDQQLLDNPTKFPRRTKYPILLHANLIKDKEALYLELANAIPEPVTVDSILWEKDSSGLPRPVRLQAAPQMPIQFSPTAQGQTPAFKRFYLEEESQVANSEILISASYPGWPQAIKTRASPYFPEVTNPPIPQSSVAAQLGQHRYILNSGDAKTLVIQKGRWPVKQDIVIPAGYTLVMNAGTTLEFAPDTVLVVYGSLQLIGAENDPVILRGISKAEWAGMSVMHSDKKSVLKHVRVFDTVGIKRGAWQPTGGMTFYFSDVSLENVSINNHQGEDALNIVRSKFDILKLTISGTLSDAVDLDFSDGVIRESQFTNIGLAGGGDAIDISGSEVQVKDVKFKSVSDKALSVGERSKMSAEHIVMKDVGTGAASKDGSELIINDLVIEQAKVAGLMAYTKKPEYGSASIEAHDVRFETTGPIGRVQTGSRITVNGKTLPSEDLDVDLLYDTVMNKAAAL